MGRGRADVLGGPGDQVIEFAGGAERPLWITEQFPGENHQIGLTGADDVVCLGVLNAGTGGTLLTN